MSMIICLLRPLNHDVMAGLAATALLMIHLVPLPCSLSAGADELQAAVAEGPARSGVCPNGLALITI